MLRDKIIVAGAGGQGALRIGQMIAYAALDEGWEVEWIPSYGAEMRGGTANCNVTISDEEILFPMIREPDYLIVMNDLSLGKFECRVRPGGVVILDSSMISNKVGRDDLHAYYVPADGIAEEEGNTRGANMVLLGAYIAVAERVSLESICNIIDHSFTGYKAKYADSNKRLVKRGFEYIKKSN
ncbi:2-oxoacid:acceptor oxidoreductase family protein [Sinanaerobacter chloroacetimidivorans]|uniref:2-oxoacid:acceptor oxidoreductase family protein n=1 Tax=Sinanaerobacter chloroacetimidivorans TaxID=2818044 RepID=A0A8J7VZX9_9FIRM|nr:2-oxoacid:acceptor oxidoreductase family protein [Sinanaerobacter chloroacetimidivorans]MBR0597814.1 2-oxoacid:acceptor oxidoreductase family protein [Sinanaerobacter chloroacetimidivorans]